MKITEKKSYEEAKIEVVNLGAEDIITTSGPSNTVGKGNDADNSGWL